MKKLWLIPALALTLAGCGNNEEDVAEEQENEVEVVEPEETEEEQEVEEELEESEEEREENSSNDEIADYEEGNVLKENLPMADLTVDLEVDNQNKRILLFENESGEKVYKSIFIKNDNHLKIIDIDNNDDEGLIFEGHL